MRVSITVPKQRDIPELRCAYVVDSVLCSLAIDRPRYQQQDPSARTAAQRDTVSGPSRIVSPAAFCAPRPQLRLNAMTETVKGNAGGNVDLVRTLKTPVVTSFRRCRKSRGNTVGGGDAI